MKLVPVSADQIRVLESLEAALSILYLDFRRDVGEASSDIAGGLHRLTLTLEALTTFWKEQSEDLAAVEARRRALVRIRNETLDASEARRVAADALA